MKKYDPAILKNFIVYKCPHFKEILNIDIDINHIITFTEKKFHINNYYIYMSLHPNEIGFDLDLNLLTYKSFEIIELDRFIRNYKLNKIISK